VIETNATQILADPVAPGPLLEPGSRHDWPFIPVDGGRLDVSRIPSEDETRSLMAYLAGFEGDRAWYAIKNERDMSRVEFAWDPADFPYAWLWQEMHAQMESPWYGEGYVMAIEPATSWPGGLAKVIATTGTHRTMQPGETISNTLTVTLSKD
jgi:hypothetical protein